MLIRRAVRFALSGVLVTVLHVVIATAFINIILPEASLANGVAFLIATVASYWVNTHWSFSSQLQGKNLFRFGVVSLLGLGLAVGISGTVQLYGLPYWYGISAVVFVVPPITFILHNFWTYK